MFRLPHISAKAIPLIVILIAIVALKTFPQPSNTTSASKTDSKHQSEDHPVVAFADHHPRTGAHTPSPPNPIKIVQSPEQAAADGTDQQSHHHCDSCQGDAKRCFGLNGMPVAANALPASKLKTQLLGLSGKQLDRALGILNSMQFTDRDLGHMFITPDGSIGIDCRDWHEKQTSAVGEETITGKLYSIVNDCLNPNHQGPRETYYMEVSQSGEKVKLDTGGVNLPEYWLGKHAKIQGEPVAKNNGTIGSTEAADFSAEQVIFDHETEQQLAADAAAEPSTEAAAPTIQLLSTLVLFANTIDQPTYSPTRRQAVLDVLFNNTRCADKALRATTYGHYGLVLGAAVTVNVNLNASTTESGVMSDAMINAAKAMGYNTANYDRVMIMCPIGTLNGGGTSWYGYGEKPGKFSWYAYKSSGTSVDGFVHELGHNFGFGHSGKTGESSSYGDVSCVMGLSHHGSESKPNTGCATFGAPKKAQAGWASHYSGSEAVINSDATYDLYPLAVNPDVTPGMRIVRSTSGYYASYVRENPDIYGKLWEAADHDKVIIHEAPAFGDISRKHPPMNSGTFQTNGLDIIIERYGPNNEYVTVSYDFEDGNTKPTANDVHVATQQNQAKVINLPAFDQDPSDTLTFSIIVGPANGTLSGSNSSRTYTPNANYLGSDSFVYKVTDGKISSFGTITISVFDSSGMLITSPNGGETYGVGTTHNIYWGSSADGDVTIDLYKGGSFHSTIVGSTPNDGAYTWTVPIVEYGANYTVKITRQQSPNESDSSDSPFSITSSMNLQTPQGGETWARSTAQTIKWTSTLGGQVKIELYKAGTIDRTIASSTPNDGSFTWTIPTLQALGGDYSIRISSVEAPAVFDTSSSSFSIGAPSNTILNANLDTNPGFATTGQFEYGTPVSPNVPAAARTGTKIYDTDLDYTCFGTVHTLTTPVLNCKNHSGITLEFWANVHMVPGNYNALWEISTDGTNWAELGTTTGIIAWTKHSYDISAYAAGQEHVLVRWSMVGDGSQYGGGGLAIDDILITGTFSPDPPKAGISLAESGSSTVVSEAGATDTYAVKLDSQPSKDVVVTISADNTEVTASPSSLTFTSSNWNTPKTVTISAINDNDHELIHTGTITHSVSSQDSNYNGISVGSIIARVVDNDNTAPTAVAGDEQTVYLGKPTPADPVAGADIFLNAGADDGANATWEDALNKWNLSINAGVSWIEDAGSTYAGISSAYDFPGGTGGNGGCDGASLRSMAVNGKPITLEIWFKPDSSATYPSHGQILWETGGSTGLGIFYNDGFVEVAHDGNLGRIRTDVRSMTDEFIQAVVTYDTTSSTNNFKLYINGELKLTSSRNDVDISGTDGSGLGNRGGNAIGGSNSDAEAASFDGKIAIFRSYHDQILSAAEVLTNFDSIAGVGSVDVDLAGSASDPDGDAITTSWSVVSQPVSSKATFTNPGALSTTVTLTALGDYQIQLTASDGNDHGISTVWIHVVAAGPGRTITFDKQGGSGGSDSVSAALNAAMPTATAPSRTGYLFAGYFSAAGGGGNQYYTSNMSSARNWDIDADTTLYADWIETFSGWSGSATFSADANGDGIPNGLAWLLGATGPGVNANGLMPKTTSNSGNLVLSFTCLRSANRAGASLKVQASDDLGATDPWNGQEAEVPDTSGTVNGITFTITPSANPDLIGVQASIPVGSGKCFGRLMGTP